MQNGDSNFVDRLDGWILPLLETQPAEFEELLVQLPGVYPTDVFESLARLQKSPKIPQNIKDRIEILTNQKGLTKQGFPSDSGLYVPHPLDYDWRFSSKTVIYLLEAADQIAGSDASVAFLGAPTVFWAATQGPRSRRAWLLDRNVSLLPCLKSQSRAIKCDLTSDPLPTLEVDLVIADPPWYPEYIQSFLWAGCVLSRHNGYLIICLPPLGTRPGIEAEHKELLYWSSQAGLKLVEYTKQALHYETPPFETNALLAADFASVAHNSWRHGDLAVFKRISPLSVTRPPPPMVEGEWAKISIKGVRIFIKISRMIEFGDPRLKQLVEGDVLPSVSRRDSRRARVDVWTSGNRVYSCGSPHVLRAIGEALARGHVPLEQVKLLLGRSLLPEEEGLVAQASEQLENLARQEAFEYLRF